MAKVTISLSISPELLEKLDFNRRLIPRSIYVEFLLKKVLFGGCSDE